MPCHRRQMYSTNKRTWNRTMARQALPRRSARYYSPRKADVLWATHLQQYGLGIYAAVLGRQIVDYGSSGTDVQRLWQ
ncbi:hypothetical protein CABS03_15048 [Colletotrichum abscissum]